MPFSVSSSLRVQANKCHFCRRYWGTGNRASYTIAPHKGLRAGCSRRVQAMQAQMEQRKTPPTLRNASMLLQHGGKNRIDRTDALLWPSMR